MPNSERSNLIVHETKRSTFLRFLLVLVVVVLYFIFVSFKYGVNQGFWVTILTWSFFVFCTPIADAGFLIDFPVRLITKFRMLYSEIVVWIFAMIVNIYFLAFNQQFYDKTVLLKLFRDILLQPFPFWAIIVLSALGTYLSIYFGDELLDVALHKDRVKYAKHKNKFKIVVLVFIIVAIIILYDFLLKELGVKII